MSSRARIVFTYRLTPYYGKGAITFLTRTNSVLAKEVRKQKSPWKWKEAWQKIPHLHPNDIFKVFLEPKACNRRRSVFYAELKKLGISLRGKRVKGARNRIVRQTYYTPPMTERLRRPADILELGDDL